MKEIQLSKEGKNRGKYVALVDDEDFEYLNQFKWCTHKGGNTFYVMRKITVDGKRIFQYMHNVILNRKWIDHKDHNGLNNQRSNLRFCTQGENNMNTRKRENTLSIYKGVGLCKRDNKWKAQIMINRKSIYLGYFDTEAEAALAYNTKAIELYGEFANLNNIN